MIAKNDLSVDINSVVHVDLIVAGSDQSITEAESQMG